MRTSRLEESQAMKQGSNDCRKCQSCRCRLNAYKCYYRAGNKAGESAEKDRKKAFWYMRYYVKISRGDKVDLNKTEA